MGNPEGGKTTSIISGMFEVYETMATFALWGHNIRIFEATAASSLHTSYTEVIPRTPWKQPWPVISRTLQYALHAYSTLVLLDLFRGE